MKKTLILLVAAMISTNSVASGSAGDNKIKSVQQRECVQDKGFQISLDTPHNNPDSCSSNTILKLSCDSPIFDTIVSMSLTALAANKVVNFRGNGCDSEGQAKVVALILRK